MKTTQYRAILFFVLAMGITQIANALPPDLSAMLQAVVSADSTKDSQITSTHSLYFTYEVVTPPVPDYLLMSTAEGIHAGDSTSSTQEIFQALKTSQSSTHRFFRLHYVNIPDTQIWEQSMPVQDLAEIEQAPIGVTFADCRATTDGLGFYSECDWGSKTIRIRDGERQSLPSALGYGRLTSETLVTFQNVLQQGLGPNQSMSIESDSTSNALVLNSSFQYWNPSEGTTDTTEMNIRAAYSADSNLDLLRETIRVNSFTSKDITYSDYQQNTSLNCRYPGLTKHVYGNGPVIVHRIASKFTWKFDTSIWDLGLSKGFDLINTYYILIGNNFHISTDPRIRTPAGIEHWASTFNL